jgi:hypothetical protein
MDIPADPLLASITKAARNEPNSGIITAAMHGFGSASSMKQASASLPAGHSGLAAKASCASASSAIPQPSHRRLNDFAVG